MPERAKVRSLHVRPFQSTDLAFEMGGIIGQQALDRARLGKVVTAFDISTVTVLMKADLAEIPQRPTHDLDEIRRKLQVNYLFSLQNDFLGMVLEQAISQREVAYLQRYKHKDSIVDALGATYPEKIQALESIKSYSTKRTDKIKQSYEGVGYQEGVVYGNSETTATTHITPITMRSTDGRVEVTGSDEAQIQAVHKIKSNQTIPQSNVGGNWTDLTAGEFGFKSQQTVSVSKNPEYRSPWYENEMRGKRVNVDLQDELLEATIASFSVGDAATLIDREREMIDLEIRKIQQRILQTFLVSPISGVVTAVYKDVGEAVQPGEPVLRVENNETLLIVGIVQFRAGLRIGRQVKITAQNIFESSGSPLEVTGNVVSVRGHDADDDEWDIIIEAPNTPNLPINYRFDRESTIVEFL